MKKLTLTFALSFMVINLTGQGTWTEIHPELPVRDLLAAQFLNEQEGWVVGLDGLIMHTRDGADTWTIQHNQKDESLWSVFFLDDQVGWSVGWNKIYHTTNGGGDWVPQQFPTGWIVGTYQIILRTTNGGNSWSLISNSIPDHKAFYRVKFTDELHGVAAGGLFFQPAAFVKVTQDGGLTWTETTPSEADVIQSLYFFDDGLTGWACGKSGTLLKTNDGGMTWEDKRFENAYYKDIHFYDELHGILLTGSWVRLTNTGGELWEDQFVIGDYHSQNRLTSWGFDQVLTVGYSGSINKSTDGGRTWEKINEQITSFFQNVGFFNHQDGFALIGTSTTKFLYRSHDGGHSWVADTLLNSGPYHNMQISGSSCYLLTSGHQLAKSLNNGQDWEIVDVPVHSDRYRAMQFVNSNVGYLCANQGKLVKTNNGGESWTDISLNTTRNFGAMFFVDEQQGWLIDTQGKNILRTTDGGGSWEFTTLGSNYIHQPVSIFFVNQFAGYASSDEGMLFRTENGGQSWEEWCLFSSGYNSKLFFASETEGWYTTGKRVYYTTDGGQSWDRQFDASKSVLSLFLLDRKNGWICGGNGMVARYENTVNVYEPAQQVDAVEVFPNPATNEVFIRLKDNTDQFRNIRILDIQGKTILDHLNLNIPYSIHLDISSLVTGTYLLKVETAKSQQVIKLFKH